MQPSDWNTLGLSPEQIADSALLGLPGDLYKTYTRPEDLPSELIARCDWKPNGENEYDVVTPLTKGKAWLFEGMRELQPFTWHVLMTHGSELMILESKDQFSKDRYYYSLYLFVLGRCVILRRPFRGFDLGDGDDQYGWLASIPESIARAYYWHLTGWHIPVDFPSGVNDHQLPAANRVAYDDVISSYGRREQKEAALALRQRFPDLPSQGRVTQFRSYLDTRPSNIEGPVGDQLFARNSNSSHRDRDVYHIHDGDWRNLRMLTDPAEAIDQYVEHTLLRKGARFDFLPFSKSLDKTTTEI